MLIDFCVSLTKTLLVCLLTTNLTEMHFTKDKVFLDTNILVYSFIEKEDPKKDIGRELIKYHNNQICISTQVLGELYNVITKYKHSKLLASRVIQECINDFSVSVIKIPEVIKAIDIHTRYQFHYYDSLIIAAALSSNCKILFSEDMHHGQLIEGKLKIINPFI